MTHKVEDGRGADGASVLMCWPWPVRHHSIVAKARKIAQQLEAAGVATSRPSSIRMRDGQQMDDDEDERKRGGGGSKRWKLMVVAQHASRLCDHEVE